MSAEPVLVANFATSAVLIGAAVTWLARPRPARATWLLAAFPVVTSVLLCVYVFGEDSYRGNGISRWEAYRSPGGALGSMFVLSVLLLALCAALIVVGSRLVSRRLLAATMLAGGLVSLALVTATILGFTLN
jgi:hypothetical protein